MTETVTTSPVLPNDLSIVKAVTPASLNLSNGPDTAHYTITLTNNGGSSQTISATATSQFSVGAMAGFSFASPLFTDSYGTGSQTIAPGATFTSGSLTGNGSASLGVNTLSLAAYQMVGVGTFLVPVSTLSGISILGGGGNISSNQSTTASAGRTAAAGSPSACASTATRC